MLAFNKRLAHPCLYYSILAVAGLPAVAGCPAAAGIPVVVLEKCMTEAGRRIKSMVRAVAHRVQKWRRALFYLPPLGFHCVGGCQDRILLLH